MASRKELLFVTRRDEDFDDGLSYAIYLAEMLGEDLKVLLISGKNLGEKFSDLMTAVTFAEAGEHETARRIVKGDEVEADAIYESLRQRCEGARVSVDIRSSSKDVVAAVTDFLKKEKGVDMVLVSPSITKDKSISKLVKNASRPVVTMARQAYVLDSLVERRAY